MRLHNVPWKIAQASMRRMPLQILSTYRDSYNHNQCPNHRLGKDMPAYGCPAARLGAEYRTGRNLNMRRLHSQPWAPAGRHKVKHLTNHRKAVPGGSPSGIGGGAKLEANLAPVERLLYGREEAAFALSISVRTVDYGLANGEFDIRHVGTRVLITARSLKQWANTNHYGPVHKPSRAEQDKKAA